VEITRDGWNMVLYEAPLRLLNDCWQHSVKNVKISSDKGFRREPA
jgi:hypothetical protein